MKILKSIALLGLILLTTETFGQSLPPSYQGMLNEIEVFFQTIRTGNLITKGETTLTVLNENKIALRVKHKKQAKNLTFIRTTDEENSMIWIPANDLTIDMVNKYEDYVTKSLEAMYDLAEKKSKE